MDSMPNVRASSGMIGTMYLPSLGILQQGLQDRDKAAGGGSFTAARAA